MNRNTESHFANLPSISIGRSKFDRGFTHKTTMNTGELVPVYVDPDIVPGDTVTMRQSELIRMTTPLFPVMDNCFMDFYWFFVPNRLVWDNFKRFMGENDTAPWTQTVEYSVPQIKITNDQKQTISSVDYITRDIKKGSVLNHMGIPITPWSYASSSAAEGYKEIQISALPTRAYCLIWNEFFRDENLQNPVNISKTDSTGQVQNEYTYQYRQNPESYTVTGEQYGGLPCLKVCKPHDYFTSALPGAQKGPEVSVGIFENIPITATKGYLTDNQYASDFDGLQVGMQNISTSSTAGDVQISVFGTDGTNNALLGEEPLKGIMLQADLANATFTTVNQLRQAFAIQKFYERDARGGWVRALASS